MTGKSYAQTSELQRGSLKQYPPELQAVPRNFHGFKYLPSLAITGLYDSNVFGDTDNETSDLITKIKPQLSMTKDYGNLFLSLNTHVELSRYMEQSSENKADYYGRFSGQYVLNSKWKVPFGITYSQTTRDRGSPTANIERTDKPLTTDYSHYSLGAVRTFNRLSVGLIGTYSAFKLEDGVSETNPVNRIIFSDNDHSTAEGRLEMTYEFLRGSGSSEAPEHFLYANFRAGEQNFERRSWTGNDFDGLRRDRNIYGALAGFQTKYKDIISAKIGAGVIRQDFSESSLEATQNLDFEADISYLIRPKLLLGFTAGRDIRQDNDLLQGLVESSYALSAEYELRHDLYLRTGLGYVVSDFLGDLDREDKDVSASVGLDYILNPRFSLSSEILHLQRDSSSSNRNLDKSVVSLRLKTNF